MDRFHRDTQIATGVAMQITPKCLSDMIDHVARVKYGRSLVSVEGARASLGHYRLWRHRQTDEWPKPEYCWFASFFAFELARGRLLLTLSYRARISIAIEFIIHIILENYAKDRDWKVENDLQAALDVLLSASGTPEQLLMTFRIQKWSA
jgi:hypothetical protein